MQEGGALATQRSWTVYLQTERKQVLSVRADPGPDCSVMRENDINRTSFHIHSSLINPISHSKKKVQVGCFYHGIQKGQLVQEIVCI